jgi:hypothetical protein
MDLRLKRLLPPIKGVLYRITGDGDFETTEFKVKLECCLGTILRDIERFLKASERDSEPLMGEEFSSKKLLLFFLMLVSSNYISS